MNSCELFELAAQMDAEASGFTGSGEDAKLKALGKNASEVGKAWSGS
ncbi:hypothetical protein [Parasedimentitalea psychrophila]|uniref:Uncharacterized protein n=1 Tax=Parasedimentitalea psychrophila TaxID=2997337 RepID=A0A9Y2KZS3_9RHOB|nr:hypothetical protein [Parasedimentitalea psychrophila]WIY26120.1 hypothetical protein QPJ95_04105 [Parasedimentitalea psychrophila]